MASIFLTGCGGGGVTSEGLSADAATSREQRVHALSSGDSALAVRAAGVSDPPALVVKIDHDPDAPAPRLRRAIALLDASKISFQLLDCGFYSPRHGGGGAPDFQPSWQKFSISATDLAKAKSAGFEEFDPTTDYIFNQPSVCGDTTYAQSAHSRVLQLAPLLYPDLFPGRAFEDTWEGYTYAEFSNGNYVGVKDGRVYVHNGRNWNFLDVGAIGDYIKGQ